ncbi:MAG: DnaD domain protein [Chloroflexota bacterium]|nr:DnaD domain protein [Chloroflexota bacterium]
MGVEKRPFGGFPAGALATAVPNLFFTSVLPQVSDPAELVVSLYFFFAHGRKKGQPRFLTHGELAADGTLASALASLGEGALRRGLDAAVERGTLLRLDVGHDGQAPSTSAEGGSASGGGSGQAQELYFLNTPTGRDAVAAIKAGRLPLGRPRQVGASEARLPLPNIFALYEENIGPLTPLIAEELKDAEKQYPAEWFEPAFQRAVQQNVRRWSYIAAILRQWEEKGPDYEKAGRDTEGDRRKRSPFDRYRHLIRR